MLACTGLAGTTATSDDISSSTMNSENDLHSFNLDI
jgi:hypothetical protein